MKQEKHEIRCSEIEKHLGKCCFFEKSYKNTRTPKWVIHQDGPFFALEGTRTIYMELPVGVPLRRLDAAKP